MARHDELHSASRLAAFTGVKERTITRILDVAGVKNVKAKGYELESAVRAIIGHYVEKSEAVSSDMDADKAAKMKAERISAEVDAAKKSGEFVPAADVEANERDKWTKVRVFVSNSQCLDADGKLDFLKGLHAILTADAA